jgi:hypothetical protein
LGANLVGERCYGSDVDDFQRRVGRALEEEDLRVRANGFLPVLDVAAIDQRGLHAVARHQLFDDPATGTEERAGGNDMVARLHLAEKRCGNGGHARCGRPGVFGAFQRAHALFEHVDGGIGIARIDEAFRLALEARFGSFSAFVDVALREEEGLGGFAVLRSRGAAVDECGCRTPGLRCHRAFSVLNRNAVTKKPAA